MDEAGGDGAQQEAAEKTVAVGGKHDEIDAGASDDVLNDGDRVAGVDDELGSDAFEVLGGEGLEAGILGIHNVIGGGGRGGDLPAELCGVEDFGGAGADKLEIGLEALDHLTDEGDDGDVGIGVVYREENAAVWKHVEPSGALIIEALY